MVDKLKYFFGEYRSVRSFQKGDHRGRLSEIPNIRISQSRVQSKAINCL